MAPPLRRSTRLQDKYAFSTVPPPAVDPPALLAPHTLIDPLVQFHLPVPAIDALTALFSNIQDQLSSSVKVTKLGEHNYVTWKRDMTVSLQDSGLWDVVSNPPPDPVSPDWTPKTRHALAKIHDSCDVPQQSLFADLDTAHLAWEKLRSVFETRDSLTLQRLYNDFNTMRKSDSESMLAYVAQVKAAAARLLTGGEAITTPNLLNRVITGLGPRYSTLKFYLEMDPNLTEDRLIQVLLAEESCPRDPSRFSDTRLPSYIDSRAYDERRGRDRRSDIPAPHDRRGRDRSRSRRRFSPRDKRVSRRSRSRPRSSSRHRSRSSRRNSSATPGRGNKYCSHCDLFGHDLDECFKLHPELLTRRQQAQRRPYLPAPIASYMERHPAYAAYYSSSGLDHVPPPLDRPDDRRHDDSRPDDRRRSDGFALPNQLTDDTVWDYYHAALPVGQQDDWPRWATLYRYDFPIATSSCWSVQNPVAATTVGSNPGSFCVQAPQPGPVQALQPGS